MPEALRFRALRSIARIENSRKAAAQNPASHFANQEFCRRLINSARSAALREAGVWEKVIATGAAWSISPRDSFSVPTLPLADVGVTIEDGAAEHLDAINRWRANKPEEAARYDAERTAILLSVKATNRVDDWDQLLTAK